MMSRCATANAAAELQSATSTVPQRLTTHSVQLRQNSSMIFAELEQQLVRRIVDRPRLEALEKRLAKQQARVRGRNACFYVCNDQLTDPQRSDLEGGRLCCRAISQNVRLLSDEIGLCDRSRAL